VIARLLIANRGEIAIRIVSACREMGIESVAVYSEADVRAAHVAAADRAVPIGPAAPAESYLSISSILQAAHASRADAVHPGYGFLSENAAMAKACEQAGIVFVGPPSHVIAQMGSKIDARRRMEAAGVPVVPGAVPDDQSDAGLRRAVERVGFPALIKAASGGGGKGMREVSGAGDIEAGVQSARREAMAAFGNGTLYVERRLVHPHHVEVQIFADIHGQVVHVFERECSVQRRHQKIVEESPSPNVTPGLRQRITGAAVLAAKASSYRNAGTVEFLVDLSGGRLDTAPFYFLEMNTRLQVEHGVTEQVAGVDLVRAQLVVASGGGLPWTQQQLGQRGHAIEARIYAEDPSRGFLPQAGRVQLYREPRMPGIRIDSGIREGDEVSVHYDPLLAKVVASAETRDLAIARLGAALRAFPILGIHTNIPFLLDVVEHECFRAGTIHTGFLDADVARLRATPAGALPGVVRAALDAQASDTSESSDGATRSSTGPWDPWQSLRGWRTW
jgi:3-methylcrotonyl-CoA carboxylase alpha subunit